MLSLAAMVYPYTCFGYNRNMKNLTDTHCHLDDEQFDGGLEAVLQNAREAGIGFILNPGCDTKTSERAIQIAHTWPEVYAAVGWHPCDLADYTASSLDAIRAWAKDPKVLAVGEIGLDYHYPDNPSKALQKQAFAEQMAVAGELALPVIIHDREAHGDTLELVRTALNREASGVFHAYSGSVESARQIFDLGMMISIGGALTFKNARKTPEVIAYAPLDRIMLETDAPYMAPVPLRGKRNEPANTQYVAEKIAEIKKIPVERVLEQTADNARRFFKVSF